MTRAGPVAALMVVWALTCVPVTVAQTADPACPAGTPAPKFTVNGKAGPVYATHELTVRVKAPGDPDAYVQSFNLSGARLLAEEFQESDTNALRVIADAPGTLGASAVMGTYKGPDGASCTIAATAAFEVKPAEVPTVTKLRRPRPYLADPPLLKDTDFSFMVKPGASGDRSPLTVEARAVLRAKLPGKGAGAKKRTITLRESDFVEEPDEGRRPCALVCPPKVQSWPKGATVNVFVLDRGGIKVQTTLPRGIPLGRLGVRGRARTSFGVDVRVLQGSRAIARLRIAGSCIDSGQFSNCRYKKLTTKLT